MNEQSRQEDIAGRGRWWTPRTVAVGHTLHCRIGPLTLELHHAPGEWDIGMRQDAEHGDEITAELDLHGGPLTLDDYQRFMFSRDDDQIRLTPVPADRAVVIKPRQAVFLPSGEETLLYVSSPVMVRIEAGADRTLLREVPALRLSDTWFGSSTREGELCYSGRTQARHVLEEVPRRSYRAITPARIRNEGITPLPLDKLSVPVPALSIYGDGDGALWTQGISLVRGAESELAALTVDDGPPDFAGPVTLLSGPREPRTRGALVRAFSVLFGQGA
ncbi:MAG: hypothetical protein RIB46_06635 [Pseudomonadales bacterium]